MASIKTSAQQEDTRAVIEEMDEEDLRPIKDEYQKENIFLFIPNIIGYSRIVLAFSSLYYMPLHPRTCSFLYSISCLLDALDGYAARRFEQSTRFGAILDMVTDRCTTACLLVFLSSAWPRWALLFQGLISLDLASHYIHIYTTLVMSGTETSHKAVEKDRSWLLNLYYTNKACLFWTCALNELFFIALYLHSFSSPSTAAASNVLLPQWSAGALEMARANKLDSMIPLRIAIVSSPIMILKQYLNVVQMVTACKWLAEGDREMRRRAGLPKKTKKTI